jgi:hypothetical protein
VTEPVADEGETNAVNVTAWLRFEGLGDEVRIVEVVSLTI